MKRGRGGIPARRNVWKWQEVGGQCMPGWLLLVIAQRR